LYREAKTAGTLYQTALRHELRSLGLAWTLRGNGLAEIDVVPVHVLREFSRRRVEIEQRLDDRGDSSARAAQVATLATRQAKDYGVNPESLAFGWHQRADALGFTEGVRRRLLGRARRKDQVVRDMVHQTARLLSAAGLTARRAGFTRREVLQAWCAELPAGAPVIDVERLADRLLSMDEVVPLVRGAVDQQPVELRYSTGEMLATEQAVIDRAAARMHAGLAVVGEHLVDEVLRRNPALSAEQTGMVRQVLGSGNGIDVVVGVAGSGKTRPMRACREAWQAAGHPVLGAALAARAAAELPAGRHRHPDVHRHPPAARPRAAGRRRPAPAQLCVGSRRGRHGRHEPPQGLLTPSPAVQTVLLGANQSICRSDGRATRTPPGRRARRRRGGS